MGFRMVCIDCGATDFPATRLEGSDTVESLGWLLGGLPGWLYCAWRHALRTKLCAHCGSGSLVRESRAARERAAWPVPPRFHVGLAASNEGSEALVVWSGSLHDPRRRLVSGAPWLGVWLLAALGWTTAGAAVALACILIQALLIQALCAAAWEDHLFAASRWGYGPGHCHAWDAGGRPLHIEFFTALDADAAPLGRLSWKAINTEPIL